MKLSIIMPCYNMEKTLARALDSILMQQVNFEYEILIVDDASKDDTVKIAEDYAKANPQVKLLRNPENLGNAGTFYNGLSNSLGDYFCVLDGDDYYTVQDKLQRQVDFLDKDDVGEYVGTATFYLIDLTDGKVHVPNRLKIKEFNYTDFLTSNVGYYHTATYMYRNIFRGNVPEYFKHDVFRGDTSRTAFHLMYSGKKIRVMDFVGSAYYFDLNGIWSSLKEKQQYERIYNYQSAFYECVKSDFERTQVAEAKERYAKALESATENKHAYPATSIDACLSKTYLGLSQLAFEHLDYVLGGIYTSVYADSLLESLGYVFRVNNPDFVQSEVNNENIAIVISNLTKPKGGGIYREICELAYIYRDKNVFVFVTDISEIDLSKLQALLSTGNVTIICPPEEVKEGRLQWLYSHMKEVSPYRAYYYCSHNGVYTQALMDAQKCENISMFSYDHGYVCGLHNSNLNNIIVKRPTDYYLLHKYFSDKVIYIPVWNKVDRERSLPEYIPFYEHDKLITASGAARFYKVDGKEPYCYSKYIVQLLSKTGGKHYHFGHIPEEKMQIIRELLDDAGVCQDSFINIEWSDDLVCDLLANHVDIFIEPFPVVSMKMTLDVLYAGIPVISYKGLKRLEINDFVPTEFPQWRNCEEFVEILSTINGNELKELSRFGKEYFDKTHSMERLLPYLVDNKSYGVPQKMNFTDDELHDILQHARIFVKQSKGEENPCYTAIRSRNRLIRGLQCFIDHGFFYTIKRSIKKIFKNCIG